MSKPVRPPKPGFDFAPPPPKAALRFLRNKGYALSFDHRDVWREEHNYAFTVAKAMEIDILESVRAALTDNMAAGQTYRHFAKNLTPTLQKLGWWGKKELTDPLTGEVKEVTLGSPRRLKTIYRTNMRTARAAGQWERIERTKEALPYLKYELGPSREHRLQHAAWAGLVLPADDPFWKTHFPPNGWGCKCRVRQISKYELKNSQLQLSESPQLDYANWTNQRTGKVQKVPVGIDPDWSHNPGLSRRENIDRFLLDKLEGVDTLRAQVAIRDMVSSQGFEAFLSNPDKVRLFPVLRLNEEAAKAIGAKDRVAVLSGESAKKNLAHHPELTLEDYRVLPEMGENPTLIVQDNELTAIIVKKKESLYWSVVKATKTGKATFLTSFRKTNKDDLKERLKKKKIIYGKWE